MSWFLAFAYKALRFSVRHYIRSIITILLPLIPFIIILSQSSSPPPPDKIASSGKWKQMEIIYNKTSKQYIEMGYYDLYVAYCPKNGYPSELMKFVQRRMSRVNFTGFENETQIEKWYASSNDSLSYERLGVVFNTGSDNLNKLPTHLNYAIRSTDIRTDILYPIYQFPGPMEAGHKYLLHGFLALKIAIDDAFLNLIGLKEVNWTIQEFPYPAHEHNEGHKEEAMAKIIPFLICTFFLYLFSSITTVAANEKSGGIAERIRMFGVNNFVLLAGYIIQTLLIGIFSIVILSILLKIPSDIFPSLIQSNIVILWIVLIVFCIHSACFFLTVSSLFSNTNIAIFASSFLYIIPSAALATILSKSSFPLIGQFLTSLTPILYIFWAFQIIFGFELAGSGISFSNIVKVPPSGLCGLPLIAILASSILSIIILSLLYCYISNINPGPYGYAKSWHFIIPQRVKSCFQISPTNSFKNETEVDSGTRGLYERVPDNVEVGLRIVNLHKTFGNVIPIKDLSMDVYVGQITALLGHNGAGKTTTLSIISGISSPTSGGIFYKGYDIFSNLDQFRRSLGLCPQEDMLIQDLSAWEHLLFFGMLKGIPIKEIRASANAALKDVGLEERKNVIISQLSGGMKRKLCLAVALVGDPQVLILDEPTSGLDPESRREIWNILLKLRENRIMIITTHFMEEADALGDQIAIMDHGEIKCYGTPMFLKRNYGAGYQITLCSSNTSVFDDIIEFVISNVPSATVLSKSEDTIVFNFGSTGTGKLSEVFKVLETNREFQISRIGVNCTTMEDVFIKVGEEADSAIKGLESEKETPLAIDLNTNLFAVSPIRSFLQRLCTLVVKNMTYCKQRWFFYTVMIVFLPSLMGYWIMDGTNSTVASETSYPPLKLDLNVYGDTEVLVGGIKTPDVSKAFNNIIKEQSSHLVEVKNETIIDALLKSAVKDEEYFRQSMIVAGDFNDLVPNVFFSSIAIHSPAIAVNLLYNSLLATSKGPTYMITAVHHPFSVPSEFCKQPWGIFAVVISWTLLVFCMGGIIGQCFIKFPHTERTTLLKHLQLMTGVSPFTYWISFFIWDLFIYCISSAVILLLLICLDSNGVLSINNAAGVLYLILFLFGWSGIWLAYCFSYLFKTSSNSFNCFYTGLAVLIVASLIVFNIPGAEYLNTLWTIQYILRLIPVAPFLMALNSFLTDALTRFKCSACPEPNVMECGVDREILTTSYFTKDLNRELYFLGLDWIIYLVFIMLVEFGFVSKAWNALYSVYVGMVEKDDVNSFESDVAKEKDRVDTVLHSSVDGERSTLIVDGLAKKYTRTFTAVHDISFATMEGECFGLLGVNGAGKSTTFNILTGVHEATQGNVIVKGYSLKDDKRKCLSLMGYCPQSHALGELLTGRQMLTLFANLRLTYSPDINMIVKRWISLLGLEEYADKPCGTYSGGNKRKLSAALAFINNPSIIILDEPTSGVDPVIRRKLWIVLKECKQKKQTVVISSHSMDECEAVCNRLTIMAQGYMKCIGTVQHLKSLYGQGFVILIKLKNHTSEDVTKLKEEMVAIFESKAVLKDEHMVLLHYHIYDPAYKVSALFSGMEKLKDDYAVIDDYTITDSSLEHVFLSFAKKNDAAEVTSLS